MQIPLQTIANNTVTVTFKDAALLLKVTPQITAADTVIMRDPAGERDAGLQPRRRPGRNSADRHAARHHDAAGQRRPDDRHRRHLHQQPAEPDEQDARARRDSAPEVAVQPRSRLGREPRAADFHHAPHHPGVTGHDDAEGQALRADGGGGRGGGLVRRRRARRPVAGVSGHRPVAGGARRRRRPSSGTLLSDVVTNVTTPAPCTPTTPCPTIFNDIGTRHAADVAEGHRHHDGASRRAEQRGDDHSVPRRLPARRRPQHAGGRRSRTRFDGAATGTIPAGGTLKLGFELVRHVAKQESPLVQLVDATRTIIARSPT